MQSTATVGLDGSENVGNWPSFTAAGVLQTFCVASKIATTRLNISVPPGKSRLKGWDHFASSNPVTVLLRQPAATMLRS